MIEPPTPTSANVEHGLRIDTYNDEITVSFDAYHSHFDTWDAEPGYEHVAALPFVRALLTEQIGIASWWHEDQWKGSSQLQRGERPAEEFVDGYNRIRVRSWQGALNEDRDA